MLQNISIHLTVANVVHCSPDAMCSIDTLTLLIQMTQNTHVPTASATAEEMASDVKIIYCNISGITTISKQRYYLSKLSGPGTLLLRG